METQSSQSSFKIVYKAFLDTNIHFKGLIGPISFPLLIVISAFVPMWVWYINAFGLGKMIVVVFQILVVCSVFITALFMTSMVLFNKTQAPEKPLTFWGWTKDITWPWTVEGLKALLIILAGLIVFVIPGIIKYVHYTFFHLVVFFNQDYKEGKINCLKHSKKISKGLGWWILSLFVILPHFIGEIPNQVAKLIFAKTDSLLVIYPALIISLYVVGLGAIYLCSIMYFMYFLKEKEIKSTVSNLNDQ